MVCYILVNICANITASRFTKILVREIQASMTSFAGGNNRFSLQTQRLAPPLLPVWEVLNPPLLIILLKAHRCMTSVTLADPLGAQGMRAPFSGPNSFIFMQFSEKNLQNRLAHPLWELAPPPSGKSWIRHCVNSSRVNWSNCHSHQNLALAFSGNEIACNIFNACHLTWDVLFFVVQQVLNTLLDCRV